MSLGRTLYQLGFEISPVILVNGIASQIPFQMLPIVALTQAADFTLGLLSGTDVLDLDQFLCHWKPLPGTTLISNQVGMYPFANQSVAANAVIAQPLAISMLMVCPAQIEGGYAAKLATLTVLQQMLVMHNQSGGTYTIATPGQFYTGCLLTSVKDVSAGDSKQPQHTWQFDFIQPLTTINQATQVYNSLMSKIAGGLPTSQTPSWSGLTSTTGSSVVSAAGGVIPSITNMAGSMTSSIGSSVLTGPVA
jgi:hypothetical protein